MVLEEVDFNPFKSVLITKRSVAFEDGRQTAQRSAIRLYDLHELGRMLGESGFKVTEVSGSLAHRGIFLGSHSRELILLATKRGDPPGRRGGGVGALAEDTLRTPVPGPRGFRDRAGLRPGSSPRAGLQIGGPKIGGPIRRPIRGHCCRAGDGR